MRFAYVVLPAALLLLAACADDGGDEESERDVAVETDLVTTRQPVTVIDEGDGPQACLGVVAASLPPKCDGLPLTGFDWSAYEGSFQTHGKVRTGTFSLTGRYVDGVLRVTVATSEEFFDGPSAETPDADGGGPPVRPARELSRIQREVEDTPGFLMAYVGDRVILEVEHDDGSLQRRLDEKYGKGVVQVWSALVPVKE